MGRAGASPRNGRSGCGRTAAAALRTGLALVLLVAPAQPARAAAILVDGALDVVATDAVCTLREAIANANADADTTGGDCAAGSGADTIAFDADYTITLAGSQLPAVTSAISIAGNGPGNTIVEAAATPNSAGHRVFEVGAAGSLALEQLSVRHGFCSGFPCSIGGGIYNAGTLSLSGSAVSQNGAAALGGGIYNAGELTLTLSSCSDNIAGDDGGGIHNDGGTLTATDSGVSGNRAGTVGAGIFSSGGTLSVVRSTLSGNVAFGSGGGIWHVGEGTLTVTNSTLSGNVAASTAGGGILNDATATVTHSTLTDNRARFEGGGIAGSGGTLTLSRSVVAGNVAFGISGVPGDGSEIFDPDGTIVGDDHNVLGHALLADADAFFDFTPGASDRTATSDGTHPTALAAILAALGDAGGPTLTHALAAGSPAIDFAPSAGCGASSAAGGIDQRGEPRGVDVPGAGDDGGTTLCDAGAYELQPPPTVPISPWVGVVIAPLLLALGASQRRLRRVTARAA